MLVNQCKTKEMIVHFGKKTVDSVVPIAINGVNIERVNNFKLLGVVFSSDLSWDNHVQYMLGKAAKQIYCILYLVRARVNQADIVIVYCSLIRSILEYACPVWHPGLSKKQSSDMEKVQKRCLKLIYPTLSYNEALKEAHLETLSDRREKQTQKLFQEMKRPDHPLHELLPLRDEGTRTTRVTYPYLIPVAKPTRYGRGFIPYCISRRY